MEGYLKVVQPIDLKNLCYIALRIAKGSDAEIMRHMQSQIVILKVGVVINNLYSTVFSQTFTEFSLPCLFQKRLYAREEEFSSSQSKVSQLQQELDFKEQQKEKHARYWEDEKSKLQATFSKEMESLKNQLLQV